MPRLPPMCRCTGQMARCWRLSTTCPSWAASRPSSWRVLPTGCPSQQLCCWIAICPRPRWAGFLPTQVTCRFLWTRYPPSNADACCPGWARSLRSRPTGSKPRHCGASRCAAMPTSRRRLGGCMPRACGRWCSAWANAACIGAPGLASLAANRDREQENAPTARNRGVARTCGRRRQLCSPPPSGRGGTALCLSRASASSITRRPRSIRLSISSRCSFSYGARSSSVHSEFTSCA